MFGAVERAFWALIFCGAGLFACGSGDSTQGTPADAGAEDSTMPDGTRPPDGSPGDGAPADVRRDAPMLDAPPTDAPNDGGGVEASDGAPLPTNALKLGIHELGPVNDPPTLTLIGGCPRVVKWLSNGGISNSDIAGAMASYRAACPRSTTVLRVYVDASTHYATTDSATADAADFWQKMQPGLTGIPPSSIDWLEGPNELDNLPDWYHDLPTAQWFATFWAALADTMNAAGFHPLVGSIAVGNPALAGDLGPGQPCAMQPLATVITGKGYRIGWSYHSYTPNAQENEANELYYSLRYRLISQQTTLAGVPIVLTEGGEDAPGGWQGITPPATYLAWLRWFDGEMHADADVTGMTIFQVGNRTNWNAFDLGPIASDLAAYESSPAAGLTCGAYAQQAGWASSMCEINGNGACGGQGAPSTDCDHCCP